MKKLIALLLACIMVLSLCACGTGDKPEASETPSPTEQVSNVDTCILMEADENMINTYSLLAVNPNAPFTDADGNAVSDVKINADGAETFIDWMLSEEANSLRNTVLRSTVIISFTSRTMRRSTTIRSQMPPTKTE